MEMHLNKTLEDGLGKQYFKKDDIASGHMPPQNNLMWGRLRVISDVLEMILMPKNMALRLMISVSLNLIWGSMNDMSFLTLLSLISIAVPGIAQVFMKVILKFLYLDILMTEDWLLPWLISENKNYYLSGEDSFKRRFLTSEDDHDFNLDD
jgi:hypothetical protein